MDKDLRLAERRSAISTDENTKRHEVANKARVDPEALLDCLLSLDTWNRSYDSVRLLAVQEIERRLPDFKFSKFETFICGQKEEDCRECDQWKPCGNRSGRCSSGVVKSINANRIALFSHRKLTDLRFCLIPAVDIEHPGIEKLPDGPVIASVTGPFLVAQRALAGKHLRFVFPDEFGRKGFGVSGTIDFLNLPNSIEILEKIGCHLPDWTHWYASCLGGEPVPSFDKRVTYLDNTKSKLPNGFGIYDMIGGVWEWCSDEVVRGGSRRMTLSSIKRERRVFAGCIPSLDLTTRLGEGNWLFGVRPYLKVPMRTITRIDHG